MFSALTGSGSRYSVVVEGFDWGPSVSRIILDSGREGLIADLRPESFSVYAVQKEIPAKKAGGSGPNLRFPGSPVEAQSQAESGAYRKVVAANRSGKHIILELEIGPAVPVSCTLRYDPSCMRNLPVRLEHTITCADGKVYRPKDCVGADFPVVDEFDVRGRFRHRDPEYGKTSLRYAFWSPARRDLKSGSRKKSARYPLVIWLHGAGEAGTDPRVALLGNRVGNLASERVQAVFSGAYILVPQCPTMWMDDGKGGYSMDGKAKYVGPLKALIDAFVSAHPDIDTGRIHIGGCSNGGYMAVRQVIDNPGFFASAFPICEGFNDDWIGERELRILSETPISFVHAKTDPTVPIARYTERTYRRLVESGASDVRLFAPDAVTDVSGRYFGADGLPFVYHGHFSWIYALNDQCSFDDGITLMEWMASRRLDSPRGIE